MFNWKYFGKVHGLLYRLSGGRFGDKMGWIKVALVETVGRKSGKRRTVPIACYPYRDSVVVSASNSGQEKHPAWYLNMRANPEVTVQLGKERYRAVAEEVPDEEREELWKTIVEMNKHQGEYLEKVERKIPLVWFRRIDSGPD
jgi:deazaflavin-dependent oxidoreductase (nitroreductase family)